MTDKTNALRILEKAGISYELLTYEVDESDLSGEHAASLLGEDPDSMFKTLVLRGDKTGYLTACIPVSCELDLKKLAKESGNKSAELLHVKELFPLTGYVRGGCSPVGMKKSFPTYIDETVILFDTVLVSAGQRGMQMRVSPSALLSVTGAKAVPLTK